jgi:hypothetical protein
LASPRAWSGVRRPCSPSTARPADIGRRRLSCLTRRRRRQSRRERRPKRNSRSFPAGQMRASTDLLDIRPFGTASAFGKRLVSKVKPGTRRNKGATQMLWLSGGYIHRRKSRNGQESLIIVLQNRGFGVRVPPLLPIKSISYWITLKLLVIRKSRWVCSG